MRTLTGLVVVGAVLAVAPAARAADARAAAPVTFSKDVAPILQDKCQACHQPNSIAPMSLITFEETRPWARSIRNRVETRQMPPWHIDRSVGVQKFKNDMSLSDEQINTIVRWVDGGALQGNPKDMPPPKPLITDNEWQGVRDGYGPPDLVIRSPEYTMAANHQDVWYRPMSDIPITEPKWARMVEIRPTTLKGRRIVHHSIAYLVLNNDPDAVNTGTATGGGTDRSSQDDLAQSPPPADGMGGRQGLRPLSSRHRQAHRARREDLVGPAHSRGRRGDHERIGNRHLVLQEGRGARRSAATWWRLRG